MTTGEQRLWGELRDFRRLYGIHARKQAPIGRYVADFVIHDRKIVIEVDGHFHAEPAQIAKDRKRDDWLEGQGYKIICLSTGDLEAAFDGCIVEIMQALEVME